MKGIIKMDMEIIDEMLSVTQWGKDAIYYTSLLCFAIIPVLGMIIGVILFYRKGEEPMTNTIMLKIIGTIGVIGLFVGLVTIGVIMTTNFSRTAKVEGDAILEKYENGGSNGVFVRLKGQDDETMKVYLDNSDVLNRKDKINQGDKVQIKSDKSYALVRLKKGVFFAKEYELREGSKLIKAE